MRINAFGQLVMLGGGVRCGECNLAIRCPKLRMREPKAMEEQEMTDEREHCTSGDHNDDRDGKNGGGIGNHVQRGVALPSFTGDARNRLTTPSSATGGAGAAPAGGRKGGGGLPQVP